MSVRVACVGGAVLDLAYGVETLPGTDGKTRALSFLEGGGGMAANAAVIVRRLGGEACWWGRVGDDDKGAFSIDTVGCATVHADICALNFGASYCSCGADIAGWPLYEVVP